MGLKSKSATEYKATTFQAVPFNFFLTEQFLTVKAKWKVLHQV